MNLRFAALIIAVSVTANLLLACHNSDNSIYTVAEAPGRFVAQFDRVRNDRFAQVLTTRRFAEPLAVFEDGVLTLEEAMSAAMESSPDLGAARARLAAAGARVIQAESRYYPNLVFTHNSTRTFHTPTSRNRIDALRQVTPTIPTDVESDPQNLAITALLTALRQPLFGSDASGNHESFSEHSSAFTTTWTLFDGFVRDGNLKASEYLQKAARFSYEDSKRILRGAIESTYLRIQLAKEQIRVALADEAFSREQLDETEKLLQARRVTQADVDNFRVRALSAQAQVTQAIGIRDTAKVVLAELMGVADAVSVDEFEVTALNGLPEIDLTRVNIEEWMVKALSNRPDLRQFDAMVAAERERVRAARGSYNPVIAVSSSWGYDKSSNMKYSVEDQAAGASIEFRWELFSGGARRGRVLEATANKREMEENYRKLRLNVRSQIQQAVIDLRDAQEEIRLQEEALETAAENRRMIKAAYLAGKETLNRLNETQRDYTTADANLALARIRLRQAWTDLREAAGVNRVKEVED